MTCFLWVGISFKRSKNGVTMAPLDARSASGSIVNEIATHFPGKSHVFDNVINYVPELEDGTTRPVMISDFDKSWEAFWLRVERVNPERLVIFGGQTRMLRIYATAMGFAGRCRRPPDWWSRACSIRAAQARARADLCCARQVLRIWMRCNLT